jgi:hypothetical protein
MTTQTKSRIKLSAYCLPNGDERLAVVAKRCPAKVIALHDHKGTLSVNWLSTPTIGELTEVIQAWFLQNEIWLEHYVCGVPLWAPSYTESNYPNPFEVRE